MLKRVLIFTAIAAVIMVRVWILRDTHVTEIEVNDNINAVEEGVLKDNKSYVLSVSPSGDKEIACTGDNELVLHVKSGNQETMKVIYQNYSPLSEDPYSMYNLEKYNIQWSQNEGYIFIRNSIYDIETDKLIEIKDNVAFMWVGNKGLYMDNGYYYTMNFDDGYSNYMAISKKINIFDAGNISTLAYAEDDKYFVWDNIHMENMFDITDDCLIMNKASLKYKAGDLQEIINKEYPGMVKAIYKKKGIDRFDCPEEAIANGSYYLENIKSLKIPLNLNNKK
ncbi:MAG: hypothetical protein K0R93_2625 [Anaerosolibacter sp.]|jgi:hypothetical protein|uniref:hypothetical protein n=1 Tax=Anaerosolibacter sp. TaxID=1872527 RepID=UPI0026323EF9|nr:hypothetical protein [Anaerosolibacter sp.]MDF2547727.1 hypothetical protein [Anaerosolibacter sp.]